MKTKEKAGKKATARPSAPKTASKSAAKSAASSKGKSNSKGNGKMMAKAAAKPQAKASDKGSGRKLAKSAAKASAPVKASKPIKAAKSVPVKAGKPARAPAGKGKAERVVKRPAAESEAPSELTAQVEPLTASETAALLDHVRAIVKRLPATTEVEAWGHPTFRVNDKIFVGYGVENGTASLGVKTTPDMQAALVSSDPRFSVAAYVGKHGWVSMNLAGAVDLAEVEALVRGSYRLVAPTKLVRQLDEAEG